MQNDLHNPQQLEPEQFGGPDGFRLLTHEEAAILTDPESMKTHIALVLRDHLNPELFNEGVMRWQRVTRNAPLAESFTYRTAAPFLEDTPEPLQGELAAMPYPQFVETLLKDGAELLATLTPEKAALWHLATLMAGEAGELLDAVKKHIVYNRDLDLENIFEELGDIGFAFQGFLDFFGFTRAEVEAGNRAKLLKRFPTGYTDAAAQHRADKQAEPDNTGTCIVCGSQEPCSHDFDDLDADLGKLGASMGTQTFTA